MDASTVRDGERVICARCQKRLKLPHFDASVEMHVDSETVDFDPPDPAAEPLPLPPDDSPPAAAPRAYRTGTMQTAPGVPQFMVVPVPVSHEPEELVQERIEDLRESRSARKERRGHYNLDRNGNASGMTGFALAMTALALALSGFLFLKALPIFTLFTSSVGFPLSIAALVCGIVGCIKPDGNKLFAAVGTAVGGALVVLVFPAIMLGLQHRWE